MPRRSTSPALASWRRPLAPSRSPGDGPPPTDEQRRRTNPLTLTRDLDQIAAGIVKDGGRHGPHLSRPLREIDTQRS